MFQTYQTYAADFLLAVDAWYFYTPLLNTSLSQSDIINILFKYSVTLQGM